MWPTMQRLSIAMKLYCSIFKLDAAAREVPKGAYSALLEESVKATALVLLNTKAVGTLSLRIGITIDIPDCHKAHAGPVWRRDCGVDQGWKRGLSPFPPRFPVSSLR